MTDVEKYAQAQLEKARKMAAIRDKQKELRELEALQRDLEKWKKAKE